MIKLFAFVLLTIIIQSISQAHDLYDAAIGKDYILANSTQCVVTTYTYDVTFRNDIKKPLIDSEAPRNLTEIQKARCKDLMAFAKGTILKAVPSKSGTRRTRDATATNYTDMRVPDTVLCVGPIIKKYQKNKNWHIIKGIPDKTTLCGNY